VRQYAAARLAADGKSLVGTKAAVFDTRIPKDEIEKNALLKVFVSFFWVCCRAGGQTLEGKGATLAAPAEGFFCAGH
jgi:hypothetical protein